jgi:uncharacterized protein YjbJ (UPF0337 family)
LVRLESGKSSKDHQSEGGNVAKTLDEAKGRAKRAVGELTGNRELKREGNVDKAAGKAKETIDKAADKAKDALDRHK